MLPIFRRLIPKPDRIATPPPRIGRRGRILLLAMALGWNAPAQTAHPEVAPAQIADPAAVVYPRPDVKLAFKSTKARPLFLYVFRPDAKKFPGHRPAIVFFHGGGWRTGDAEQFFDQSAHLAKQGMVAISAEYRIETKDGTAPDKALEDAASAFRYVRAHASDMGIDSEKIAAGGGSAGGQLAAALATVNGFDDPADDLAVSKRPAALVLFNPVVDNGPTGYGYDRVSTFWREFSPLHNIRTPHPPAVVLLGTEDAFIPTATGRSYCAAVKRAHANCSLHLFEGQKHGFFNRSKSALYYQRTLKTMDQFLKSHGFIRGK